MKKLPYLLLLLPVAFAACKEDYKKAPSGEGMEYKIIADGSGDKLKVGEIIEFEFVSTLNTGAKDSVLTNTRETGAKQILKYDSLSLPPAYFKLFGMLRKGDSLTTRIMTDSVFKKQPEGMPPFMKKGQFLYTNLRVTNIYKTDEDAAKAKQASMAAMEAAAKTKAGAQAKTDDKILTDYFTKNNIKAVKTPKGAYVEILQAGTGAMLDTGSFAKINYTGKTLDGVIFDSNTDVAKGHVEPLSVNLTGDQSLGNTVIPGMVDALLMVAPGAKAKLYIPSGLGYGPAGAGGDIKPNSNLIFEVDVLSSMTKEAAKAEKDAAQKKMQEMQQRYVDSIKKAQPKGAPAPPPR